jgi:release factor glutamine methyltransferase
MSKTISEVLRTASQQIQNALEAEILLAHTLNVTRTYLMTWPEKFINEEAEKIFFAVIEQRKQGEPIAYLIGHKEFWSLDLIVTKDVLIPRPETELLVELALKLIEKKHAVIADLGTGSGAIALALAHERPDWEIHAIDISEAALNVAKQNASKLKLTNIIFHQGDFCQALPEKKFDAILSNPPYVAENDPHLSQGDLRFEPKSALQSGEKGLQDLYRIIHDARPFLKEGGWLMVEHGSDQGVQVASFFVKGGYNNPQQYKDLAGLDRVLIASR